MTRVLLVDDDMLALSGLRLMIPWEKYNMEIVGQAANGAKALEFLENHPVDLMMVDLSMPVIDGLELIRICHERYPAVAHVVMTFHEDFEHVQKALRLGVIDYISKLKIEAEDCDEVFQRIAAKLGNKAERSCGPLENDTAIDLFANCMWLYDDWYMDDLAHQIEQGDFHSRSLEVAIADAVARIERMMELDRQVVPHLEDNQAAIMFLYDYRARVLREAEHVDNTEARILVVAGYINGHYRDQMHVERVAEVVNLSRSYLSISFKRRLGITVNDFLRRKRIFEARRLLRGSTMSVQQIANQVGYENYKHFKDVFRELTGVSPNNYRLDAIRSEQDKIR